MVRSIYRANRNLQKREHIEEFLDNFEILKLELRICADLKLFSVKQQADITVLLESIGKQATAWKNKYS